MTATSRSTRETPQAQAAEPQQRSPTDSDGAQPTLLNSAGEPATAGRNSSTASGETRQTKN